MFSTERPRRRRTGRSVGLVAILASAVVAAAACSSTGGKPDDSANGAGVGNAGTEELTIAMITHEVPGDSFWDLIRKGAEMAAKKDNVKLQYSSDPEAPNQANLVQTAIDSKVDGIAVTLAKPDAMAPAVRNAIAAGIPVVAFNSGFNDWQQLGVQQYFGQDETIAGRAVGERLTKEGRKMCSA